MELCSDGSQQFGQKSFLDQAEQMMECASQNPELFQTPSVKFAFFNGLTPAVVDAVQSRGVSVLGPDLKLVASEATQSLDAANINVLNLDITAMVAYVSALTNGYADYTFKESILTDQAARERSHPAKPPLEQLFKGKRLICCQSAASDFLTITKAGYIFWSIFCQSNRAGTPNF